MFRIESDPIIQYCEAQSSSEGPLLNRLERETYLKTLHPQMSSGMLQGRFLSMISKMIRPKRVLEIGTFTAYATLCLAEGLTTNGSIITIDSNAEIAFIRDAYIEASGFRDRITCLEGDAMHILPTLSGPFDLVFIDAAKDEYIDYFSMVIDKVSSGGFMLADNVLWNGRILHAQDATTKALHRFNQLIVSDARVENVVMPVRDGLSIIRKIG